MNTKLTPTQKRQERAAPAQYRRDVADFKKFVAYNIQQLEAGRPISIIVNVVKDPCGNAPRFLSRMVKGPPNPPS